MNDYAAVVAERDEARAAARSWEDRYGKAMNLLAATVDLANLAIASGPEQKQAPPAGQKGEPSDGD
jgi:hypothetical protein